MAKKKGAKHAKAKKKAKKQRKADVGASTDLAGGVKAVTDVATAKVPQLASKGRARLQRARTAEREQRRLHGVLLSACSTDHGHSRWSLICRRSMPIAYDLLWVALLRVAD